MMKTIRILIIIFFAAISGCNLFENQQPQQSLSSAGFPSSAADVDIMINGIYSSVLDTDLNGTNFLLIPELLADNIVWTGSFTSYRDLSTRDQTPDNAESQSMWNDGYRTINNVNLLLDAMPNITEGDISNFPQIQGEALFIRGMMYFEMTRFFGNQWGPNSASDPGVAITTTGVADLSQLVLPSRGTVADGYAQAIADLTQAAGLMGDNNSAGRATRFTALGYLMRIAMQQGDYAAAANFADQIITSGQFSLNANPLDFYQTENSAESIWEIKVTVLTGGGNPNTSLGAVYNQFGRDDIFISADFDAAIASIVTPAQAAAISGAGNTFEDLRNTTLRDPAAPENTFKYEDFINFADDTPTMRYAEVLLTRAEALAELNGVNQESVDLLNMVRQRAIRVFDGSGTEVSNADIAFTTGDFATTQDLINAILLERRIELAFEGHRLHDLKRRGLPIRGIAFDDPLWVLPIAQSELDANSNMTQNPGY